MGVPIDIIETELPGVLEIRGKRFADERGFFTEVYGQAEWAAKGFEETFVQDNLSRSRKGTLRGMHYQLEPHGMGKLVRALRGAVFDVAVDLREASPTHGQWVGRTLTEDEDLALWVPAGFAHGFLALEDDTLFLYKCTALYAPESERAFRYDDPEVGIVWPAEVEHITAKDREAPLFREAEKNFPFAG